MRGFVERYFKDVVPRNGKDNAFQVSQELDHFRFAIRKQSTWSYSRLRIEVTPPPQPLYQRLKELRFFGPLPRS